MPQAKGSLVKIQVDFETTFATDPGVPNGRLIAFNSCSIKQSAGVIIPATITGDRKATQPSRGNISIDGDLVIPLDSTPFLLMTKGLLGAPVTTGGGDPYTHTFKVGTSIPSMVIEKMFTDIVQYEKFNGCKVSAMKLTFGGDGELVSTFTIVGAKGAYSGTSYDSTPTSLGALDRLSNFQGVLKEGGSVISTVLGGEINFDNGLDTSQYCVGNNGARGDIPEGTTKVSGKITALFTDLALITKALNATETSLELTFTSGTHSLAIKVPELYYQRTSPEVPNALGLTLDLAFDGFYNNDADATPLKVVILSPVAAAALA